MNDNDLQFEKAAAFLRAMRMIRYNGDCDRIAEDCRLDPRFVLALMCLVAMEDGL